MIDNIRRQAKKEKIMSNENKKKSGKTFKNSLKGSRFWGLMVFLILVIVDQITKMIADVYLNIGQYPYFTEIHIIPGMLTWGPMNYERSFAFSAWAGNLVWVKFLLVWIWAILMGALAYVYYKADKNRTWFRWALILIIAGGMANFFDRINYGVWDPLYENGGFRDGVREMFHIVFIFDFGYCNFADLFMVAGVITMIIALLFFDSYALYPHGKYEKMSIEAKRKANERKREKYNKKYGKMIEEANKK